MPPVTNNVTRFLDACKITYTAYEVPEEKLGALGTALFLKVSPEIVFKTIVVMRERAGKPILALAPGTTEVDLKKLACEVHERKLHLPTEREAEQITGLRAGGISPLALINRGFLVVIDQSAIECGIIHISGGQRGLNIRLSAQDLVKVTNARVAYISRTIGEG
jgi:Cys-tRNA(Pro)/Cys-tRNA(Cys) deacylase